MPQDLGRRRKFLVAADAAGWPRRGDVSAFHLPPTCEG